MGVLALLLILGREFVYTSARWQEVLHYANLPLYAVLNTFFLSILYPLSTGPLLTHAQVIIRFLPYYALFFLTYIGYGIIVDFVIRKAKKSKKAL